MSILQGIQRKAVKKELRRPVIQPGYTVRVHQKIKEGSKERIQIFEGLVIKVNSGHGADKTFTVRKIVEGIGVEKIFPLYSPKIEKIEVKKKSKVRRSKLYYMRERSGKSARLKESFISSEELEKMLEVVPDTEEETNEKAEAEVATEESTKTEETKEENKEQKSEEVKVEKKEEVKEEKSEKKEEPKEEAKKEEKTEEK